MLSHPKTPTTATPPALPLHDAIQQGALDKAMALIVNAVELEAKDSRGMTPSLLAAQLGNLDLLKALHAAKANLNATTLDGQTALHLAARSGHVEAVTWLWQQGLNPLQCDNMGKRVLHEAVHHSHHAVVKQILLLATGEQQKELVHGQDNDGKTALHYASFQTNADIVTVLIQAGANVNACNHYGYTPLHVCARSGHAAVMDALLEHGAEVIMNSNGDYPVHLTLHFGHTVWAKRWYQHQRQSLGENVPEKLQLLLEQAEQEFIQAKTLDELNQAAASYTQTLTEAEDHKVWPVVFYSTVQLSDMELRKALYLQQLSSEAKDPHKQADYERRSLQCYAQAAKYASCAEVLRQQHKLKRTSNTFSSVSQHVFSKKRLRKQQHRIQRRFIQEVLQNKEATVPLPASLSRTHRKQLRQLRNQLRQDISNESVTTEFLLSRLTQGFIDFTHQLIQACIETVGSPSCRYAVLGLGSMARNEMSPYSDLEFAIVLDKDTPENKTYFRHLTRLLELQVITLNETKLPLLEKGTYSPVPPGFSFDSGGNTPLGKEGLFELIATPEQLAQFQQMDWFEQEVITSNVLKTVCHITGDPKLTEQYEAAVRNVLDGQVLTVLPNDTLPKPTRLDELLLKFKLKKPKPQSQTNQSKSETSSPTPRQQQALHLLAGDLAEYTPQLGEKKEQLGYFDIKKELYRLPSSIVQELSLFYGLTEKGTFVRLKALHQQGYLSEGGLTQLSQLFDRVLRYRLKAHLFYQREKESLYHPELLETSITASNVTSMLAHSITVTERRLELTTNERDHLAELHKVLLPLERVTKLFWDNKGEIKAFWDEKTFYDDSRIVQGIIFENTQQYPKAKACYEDALALNPHDIDALNCLGNLKEQLGETAGRLERLKKALAVALNLRGSEHSDVALSYNNLGEAYRALGQKVEALKCHQQALGICLKVYGKSHPHVATSTDNLGTTYLDLGQAKEALMYHQQALAIRLKVYGESHPRVAISTNNLGLSYQALGQIGEALKCHQQALTIDLKVYDKSHPHVAASYHNLGSAYHVLGQAKDALKCHQQALTIRLKVYGGSHPSVGASYSNMGEAYRALGQAKKALTCHQQALTICLNVYGELHPGVAASYHNLGAVYQALGQVNEALTCHQQALTICLNVYGASHPHVATSTNSLGGVYRALGRPDEALTCHQQALMIYRKVYDGKLHPHVATSLNNLGLAYDALGQADEALKCHQEALVISLNVYGESHPDVATSYDNLGNVYHTLGQADKALKCHQEALTISLNIYGELHPSVATSYGNLGSVYQALGRADEALECQQQVLTIRLNAYGELHPDVAISYNNLGAVYFAKQNFVKAQIFFTQAQKIRLNLLGPQHPHTQGTQDWLQRCQQALLSAPAPSASVTKEAQEKALRTAAHDKNSETLTDLLQQGVNVNAQDTNPARRRTALHWAVEKKFVEGVKLLLNEGAQVTIADADGRTALEGAEQSQQAELIAVVQGAFRAKYKLADFSSPQLEKALRNAALRHELADLVYVLRRVHNPNVQDQGNYQRSALHWAVEKNFVDGVEVLLQAGADPLLADKHGDTPLSLAQQNPQRATIAQQLLAFLSSTSPQVPSTMLPRNDVLTTPSFIVTSSTPTASSGPTITTAPAEAQMSTVPENAWTSPPPNEESSTLGATPLVVSLSSSAEFTLTTATPLSDATPLATPATSLSTSTDPVSAVDAVISATAPLDATSHVPDSILPTPVPLDITPPSPVTPILSVDSTVSATTAFTPSSATLVSPSVQLSSSPHLVSTSSPSSDHWRKDFFHQQFALRERIVQPLRAVEGESSVAFLRWQVLHTPGLPGAWRQALLAVQPPEQVWSFFDGGYQLRGWYGPVLPAEHTSPDVVYIACEGDSLALLALVPLPKAQVGRHQLTGLDKTIAQAIRTQLLEERTRQAEWIEKKQAELKQKKAPLTSHTFVCPVSPEWTPFVLEALAANGLVYPAKAPPSWNTSSSWYEDERIRRQAVLQQTRQTLQALVEEGAILKQEAIVKALTAVLKRYDHYHTVLEKAHRDELPALLNPCGQVRGVDIEGTLTLASHRQLFAHAPDGRFSNEGRTSTTSKNIVKFRDGLYYKFFCLDHGDNATNFPAMAQAVHSLHQVLAHEGTAVSQLVLFQWGKKRYPVLVSEGIEGMTLEAWLARNEARSWSADDFRTQMEGRNFSVMILLSLLTGPQDAKKDNYVMQALKRDGQPTSWRLVNIDADHAFSDWLIQETGRTPQEVHARFNVRDVLYGFPQMGEAVHPALRKQIAAWEPEQVMVEWLYVLMLQAQTDQALQTQEVLTPEERRLLQVPLLLRPDTFARVFQRLQAIVRCCRQLAATITHWDWLHAIAPDVAMAYQDVLHQVLSRAPELAKAYGVALPATPLPRVALMRYDESTESGQAAREALYERLEWQTPPGSVVEVIQQFFSAVWDAPLRHPLPAILPPLFDFLDERTQPVTAAIETWLATLSWSTLTPAVAKHVTSWIIRFPGVTRLSFQGNQWLTETDVHALLLNPRLTSLNLVGCTGLAPETLKLFCAALRGRPFHLTVDIPTVEAWPGLLAAVDSVTVDFEDGTCWPTNRGAQWMGGLTHALTQRSVRGVAFFRRRWEHQPSDTMQAWKEALLNAAQPETGHTPLHILVQRLETTSTSTALQTDIALIVELVRAGANLNVWDKKGVTPFVALARVLAKTEASGPPERLEAVKPAFDAMWPHVAWESVNGEGDTVLSLFLRAVSAGMLAWVQAASFSVSQQHRWLAACRFLSPRQWTVAHALACNPNVEVLKWLLTFVPAQTWVTMNPPERDLGYTPLHLAARHGHVAVVKALLQAGAKPTPTATPGRALWPSDLAAQPQTALPLSTAERETFIALLHEAERDVLKRSGRSHLLTQPPHVKRTAKTVDFFNALQQEQVSEEVMYGETLPETNVTAPYALIRRPGHASWTLYEMDEKGRFQKEKLRTIPALEPLVKAIPATMAVKAVATSPQAQAIADALTQHHGTIVVKWQLVERLLKRYTVDERAAVATAPADDKGQTVWHMLAEGPLSHLPEWQFAIEQRLQEPRYQAQLADAEETVVRILTLLKASLEATQSDAATTLLAAGLSALGKARLTPVQLAIQSRRPAVAAWFLAETPSDVSVAADEKTGNTVFHWTLGQVGGRMEMLKVLVAWCSQRSAFDMEKQWLRPNFQGHAPLYYLFDKVPRPQLQKNRIQPVSDYHKQLSHYQQQVLALWTGWLDSFDLEKVKGRNQRSLLHLTIANGCADVAVKLLDSIPAATLDNQGQTALYEVVWFGMKGRYLPTVKVWRDDMRRILNAFVTHGVDFQHRDYQGRTALEVGRAWCSDALQRLGSLPDGTPEKETGRERLLLAERWLAACTSWWQEAQAAIRSPRLTRAALPRWYDIRNDLLHHARLLQLLNTIWHRMPIWTTGVLRTPDTQVAGPLEWAARWNEAMDLLLQGASLTETLHAILEHIGYSARQLAYWSIIAKQRSASSPFYLAPVWQLVGETALQYDRGIELLVQAWQAPAFERERMAEALKERMAAPVEPAQLGEVLWQEAKLKPLRRRPLVGALLMATVSELVTDENVLQSLWEGLQQLGETPEDTAWRAWLQHEALVTSASMMPWFTAAMTATATSVTFQLPQPKPVSTLTPPLPASPSVPLSTSPKAVTLASVRTLAEQALVTVSAHTNKDFHAMVNPAYEYEDSDVQVLLELLVKRQGLGHRCEVLAAVDTITPASLVQRLKTAHAQYPNKTWLIPYNQGGYHWTGLAVTVTSQVELVWALYVDPLFPLHETPSCPALVRAAFQTVFGETSLTKLQARAVKRQPDSTSCGAVVVDTLVMVAQLHDTDAGLPAQALTHAAIRQRRAAHLALLNGYYPFYYQRFAKKQQENAAAVAPLSRQQAWLSKPLKFSPEEMKRIQRLQTLLAGFALDHPSLHEALSRCFQPTDKTLKPKAYCDSLRAGFQALWLEHSASLPLADRLQALFQAVLHLPEQPLTSAQLLEADLQLTFEEVLAIGQTKRVTPEAIHAREAQLKADEALARKLQDEDLARQLQQHEYDLAFGSSWFPKIGKGNEVVPPEKMTVVGHPLDVFSLHAEKSVVSMPLIKENKPEPSTTSFLPALPFESSSKTKSEPRFLNLDYEYEDNDINVLLTITMKTHSALFGKVEVLGACDSLFLNGVTQQLQEVKQRYHNHICLIPYNCGGYHWVGILIEQQQGVFQRVLCVDPLGIRSPLPVSLHRLANAIQQTLGTGVQFIDFIRQPDTKSCGSVVVEALLLLVGDLTVSIPQALVKQALVVDGVSWASGQPTPSHRALLQLGREDIKAIRQEHLQRLAKSQPDAVEAFYQKQLHNTVTVRAIEEQHSQLLAISTVKFSPSEWRSVARMMEALQTLSSSVKAPFVAALQVKEKANIEAVTYWAGIRQAFIPSFKAAREGRLTKVEEAGIQLLLEEMLGLTVSDLSVLTSVEDVDFRVSYELVDALGTALACDAVGHNKVTVEWTQVKQASEEQCQTDEALARQLQAQEYGEGRTPTLHPSVMLSYQTTARATPPFPVNPAIDSSSIPIEVERQSKLKTCEEALRHENEKLHQLTTQKNSSQQLLALQELAERLTTLLIQAEALEAWSFISRCTLSLSEVELQKAGVYADLAAQEQNPIQRGELECRGYASYAHAAKYASTGEVLWHRSTATASPRVSSSSFPSLTSSSPATHLDFTALKAAHFLAQHHRIQTQFIHATVGTNASLAELPFRVSLHARAQLKELRLRVTEDINNESYTTELLLQRLTQGFIHFIRDLLKPCMTTLGPPPCVYAFLGLGSMARGEMSPYSDLEFAIVIGEDTSSAKAYFRHVTRLLELHVISLNETKFSVLAQGTDSPVPPGFSFDSGGNTPLGKAGLFELIATPEQLAQFQQMDWFEQELITSNVLKTVCHITGDIQLTEQYEAAVQTVLEGQLLKVTPTDTLPKPKRLDELLRKLGLKKKNVSDTKPTVKKTDPTPRQQQALHLLKGDVSEYSPKLGQEKERLGCFNIKQNLYRLPSSVVQELSLFYGIQEKGTWTRLAALHQGHYLSKDGYQRLTALFDDVLRYRLWAHLFYQQEKEALYHPDLIKAADKSRRAMIEKEPRFELTTETLDRLVEFHKVLLPLLRTTERFIKESGQTPCFEEEKNFYDESLVAQGKVFEEKLNFQAARKCYEEALSLHPQDVEALNRLGNLKEQLGETEGRLDLLKKALVLAQMLHGENSVEVATTHLCVGLAYCASGDIQQPIVHYEKALEISLQVYGEVHPEVAVSYAMMGTGYQALGDAQKAVGHYKKALEIQLQGYGEVHLVVAGTYNYLGMAYQTLGDAQQALMYQKKALEIWFQIYHEAHPYVATSYYCLGLAYQGLGDSQQALVNHEKALKIWLQIYDKIHPFVATSYNALGSVYFVLDNAQQAVGHYEKALEILHQVYGEVHLTMAPNYSALGTAYQTLGNAQQAVTNCEKGLKIWLQAYNEVHPIVVGIYITLGLAYLKLGDAKQAVVYYEKALNVRLKLHEKAHPDVAASYNHLGWANQILGDAKQAVGYYEKALNVRLKLHEKAHPDVAASYSRLGKAYQTLGDYQQAVVHHQKALEIQLQVYDKAHPDVATSYSHLGQSYQILGDAKQAVVYHQKALEVELQLHEKAHPDVATSYSGLGLAYEALGDAKQAVASHKKALEIRLQLHSEAHPDVARSYNNLGLAYEALGDAQQAVASHKKALEIRLQLHSEAYPDVATSYNNLGWAYEALGDAQQAVASHEKALEIRLQLHSEAHPDVAKSYTFLGLAYQALGDAKSAIVYHEKGLKVQLELYGEGHFNVATSYSNLGEAYRLLGQVEQAIDYQQKALTMYLKAFGSQHPNVGIIYHKLGCAYLSAKESKQALTYQDKALEMLLKAKDYGESHARVAIVYRARGEAFEALGQLKEAQASYEKALNIQEKKLPAEHPERQKTVTALQQLKMKVTHTSEKTNVDLVSVATSPACFWTSPSSSPPLNDNNSTPASLPVTPLAPSEKKVIVAKDEADKTVKLNPWSTPHVGLNTSGLKMPAEPLKDKKLSSIGLLAKKKIFLAPPMHGLELQKREQNVSAVRELLQQYSYLMDLKIQSEGKTVMMYFAKTTDVAVLLEKLKPLLPENRITMIKQEGQAIHIEAKSIIDVFLIREIIQTACPFGKHA